MKQILGLILLTSLVVSCKKDANDPPEVIISRDSLLVSNTWQMQQINVVQNDGTVLFYKRGGQNNSWNYDDDYLKFERNGTGIYNAGTQQYEITWQFDNSDKTELSYTIHNYSNGGPQENSSLDIKLENVYLSESSFRYAELYTNENGTQTICSVYREPKLSN
jgi:hypothetical protein